MREIHLTDILQQARNFQAQRASGHEYLDGWKLPPPKTAHIKFTALIKIYELVEIGKTTYQKSASMGDTPKTTPATSQTVNIFTKMLSTIRESLGPALSGLGLYLAITNLASTLKKAQQEGDAALHVIDLVGAASTLIGASIESGATAIATYHNLRGNPKLSSGVRYFAAKRGIALYGTGGVALTSIIDSVRSLQSIRDNNPEQAAMYFGSAFAGGVVAFATWAGGTAAAASIASNTTVAVLGLTPLGWSVISLIVLGIAIAFVAGVDSKKHGPIEVWLKHSAWGKNHRHYFMQEELDTIHNLYYRPRIFTEWAQTPGYRVGTLRIAYELPNITDNFHEHFQHRLSVKIKNYPLRQITGPIAHAPDTQSFDPQHECLITPTYSGKKPTGWAIQMHQSARVELEYLFLPNLNRPDLYINQQGAPSALEFRASNIFSETIDPIKLEPVNPPR